MRSEAATPQAYLDQAPPDRGAALEALRALILRHLPDGYVEAMNWGMISYEVPLALSGKTYNGQPLMVAALANQKRHMALYLCGLNCVPGLEQRFRDAFADAGKKLDLGKACVRFRRLEDLDLDAVADAIAAVPPAMLIEASRATHGRPRGHG